MIILQEYKDVRYMFKNNFYRDCFSINSAILRVESFDIRTTNTQYRYLDYLTENEQNIGILDFDGEIITESSSLNIEESSLFHV
jgi:hypothetical protein